MYCLFCNDCTYSFSGDDNMVEEKFYIDGYLKSNLDMVKEKLREDWDMIFLVDGIEGAGKSVLGMQMAKYVDPTFSNEQIAFTPQQFMDAIKKAPKYTSVLYDEAYFGLSARGAMTQTNRVLVSMLSEIRQKNLFVVIILPTFFDLDKNVALWRTRALIHVYVGEGLKRGRFMFFNQKKKTTLYILGKKTYSYSKPASDFIASFTNKYVVNEKEYRANKHKALMDKDMLRKEGVDPIWAEHYIKLLNEVYKKFKLSQEDLAEMVGVERRAILRHLKGNIGGRVEVVL